MCCPRHSYVAVLTCTAWVYHLESELQVHGRRFGLSNALCHLHALPLRTLS